jgi:hypothetical protein
MIDRLVRFRHPDLICNRLRAVEIPVKSWKIAA